MKDKHPQITNYLSKLVQEFYKNKKRKQLINSFKTK